MHFETLGLCPELLKAVTDLGFDTPMPVQEKTIPVLLHGDRDLIGLAQTGTGKTAAFGLPLIQQIDDSKNVPQGLVLCPTRELCVQITSDLKAFTRHLPGVHIAAVYGGAGIAEQIRRLKKRVHIIVATPGRLLDLMDRGTADLSGITRVVLDEADEMLNMGFQEDIDLILEAVPEHRRTWLFSATMPKRVAALARRYLADPLEITVGSLNAGPGQMTHTCYLLREKDKYQGLRRIIDFTPDIFGLVFCRTRVDTQDLADALTGHGYNVDALHGDLSQAQRDHVMRKFRQGALQLLVATDVAARGLDISDITHVIHYHLPDDVQNYTHRSGRTARAGKSGVSVALISPREMGRLRELEARAKVRFTFGRIPDGRAICERQAVGLAEKLLNTEINLEEVDAYLPSVIDRLASMDKEELIRRIVAIESGGFIAAYRDAQDIGMDPPSEKKARAAQGKSKGKRKVLSPAKKSRRFHINIGRLDKIDKGGMLRLICDRSGVRSDVVGTIELKREFSFVDIDHRAAAKVSRLLNKGRFGGRQVEVREVVGKKRHRKGETV